jgi:hypothetical protein
MYELPAKSVVGAIHKLPLPPISEIASQKSSMNSATPSISGDLAILAQLPTNSPHPAYLEIDCPIRI